MITLTTAIYFQTTFKTGTYVITLIKAVHFQIMLHKNHKVQNPKSQNQKPGMVGVALPVNL